MSCLWFSSSDWQSWNHRWRTEETRVCTFWFKYAIGAGASCYLKPFALNAWRSGTSRQLSEGLWGTFVWEAVCGMVCGVSFTYLQTDSFQNCFQNKQIVKAQLSHGTQTTGMAPSSETIVPWRWFPIYMYRGNGKKCQNVIDCLKYANEPRLGFFLLLTKGKHSSRYSNLWC